MVRIAGATVAVSMAVMIVAMAVIFGFKKEVSARLVGFAGHVEVVNFDGNTSMETTPIERSAELGNKLRTVPHLTKMAPYAIKGGVVKTTEAMQGVMLKGVDSTYDWSFFAQALQEGELPDVKAETRKPDILISRALADLLMVKIGDKVEMLFVQQDSQPRRYAFRVSGIYKTGFEEMDRLVVPTDLRNVQRLARWDVGQVTGYELVADDFGRLAEFEQAVRGVLPAGLLTVSVETKHPQMFDWLRAHDVNALVIIVIMVAVALLNMIAALLIILLERTRMIGLLKALGMNNGALRRVFLARSAVIVLRGMLWGNVVGIGLCLAQKWWHLVSLSQVGYFLTEVPISLGAGWLTVLNVGAFVLILSLLTIPTLIISRITPEKTIRFQ